MKAIKVDTDNKVSIVELDKPLYQTLDKLLGGTPEHVRPRRLPSPLCMMVDDSGLLKRLPLNFIGSYFYETDKHSQPIVGDIYILREQGLPGGSYDIVGLEPTDIAVLGPQIAYLLMKLPHQKEDAQ